jgi:hypothetical protein
VRRPEALIFHFVVLSQFLELTGLLVLPLILIWRTLDARWTRIPQSISPPALILEQTMHKATHPARITPDILENAAAILV